MTPQDDIDGILRELVARVCSMFGASLEDLNPEDAEPQFKAKEALLALIHDREVRARESAFKELEIKAGGFWCDKDRGQWQQALDALHSLNGREGSK